MSRRKLLTAASAVAAGMMLNTSAIAAGGMAPVNAIPLSKLQTYTGQALHLGAAAGSADFAVGTNDARVWLIGSKDEQDKAEKDKAEKDKAEKDKAEKDKAEKDKAEKDKAEKDKAEKDKAEKDKAEKDKAEKDKAEKDKAEKDKAEKDKAEKDKAEKDKAEKDKEDKEDKKSGNDKEHSGNDEENGSSGDDHGGNDEENGGGGDDHGGGGGNARMQLFIEDAIYEGAGAGDPETWAKLGTTAFNLWVVGNVSGNGLVGGGIGGPINDVRLIASFDESLYDLGYRPSLTFVPTLDGGTHGFNDLTTPDAVSACDSPPNQPFDASTVPLPSHGVLTPGRLAYSFCLGDFTETGANLANFQPDGPYPFDGAGWFPDTLAGNGQINVYRVLVEGLPVGAQVHFDVYGMTDSDDLVFAPFSHDARWEQDLINYQVADVPTPGSFALFASGLLGLGWLTRFRRKQRA